MNHHDASVPGGSREFHRADEEDTMTKDPVCGMSVDEKKAGATTVRDGKTYYFCSPGCKATFEKDPTKFATK